MITDIIKMSALDIIFSEEEWLRVYTWNHNSNQENSLAIVDSGARDTMHIVFSREGCIIKGFDHESKLSLYAQGEFEIWKGIYEDAAKGLLDLLDDKI